jgi:hypothetical protein
MNKIIRSLLPLFLSLIHILLFVTCGEKSEKMVILELMEKAGQYIEKKDVSELMMFVAEDYRDFQERDKKRTEEMAKHYFLEYQRISVHVLSTKIDEIVLDEASVQTDVLVSSGEAQLFRKFVEYAGDFYRIRAKLKKREGVWMLHYAEWTHINLEDLLPESVSLLKKIFPKLSP